MTEEKWEDEKEVYINKLERIIKGAAELEKLQGSRLITDDMLLQSKKLSQDAQKLCQKLKKDEFEIAVVGLEKSGKSSFTNALIGQSALPTDDQRCTYTSTCIRWGDNNSADIYFYSAREFNKDFSEKLAVLGIKDSDKYSINNMELNTYERLYENCPDDKKKLYEDSLNQDIIDTLENKAELNKYIGESVIHYEGEQLDNNEFKLFITAPGKAIAVKNVTIFSSELKEMPNAIIYDVPGFNSPTQMHREQTLEKMRTADAIIMVAKANEPSITGDLLQIFKNSDFDGEPLSDKLFVFANKADLATDLQKNIGITYNEWIDKRKIMPRIERSKERFVFGSANAHLKIGTAADSGIDDGIDKMRSKLEAYYKNERFDVLKKRINKIVSDIEELYKNVSIDADAGLFGLNLDVEKLTDIALSSKRHILDTAIVELDKLKVDVNNESKARPLAKDISERINGLITVEKYTVTEDEETAIHNSISGMGNSPQPNAFDNELRKKRFDTMYKEFVDSALSSASSRHHDVCERILEIFRNSMLADDSNENWSILKDKIIEQFELYSRDSEHKDNMYYQSLIERFARDVFEIHIKHSQSKDRLNKFHEAAANFFSLGVFFNESSQMDERNNKLSYINIAPKDSMLWRILLYPELASAEHKQTVISRLKTLTGLDEINPITEKLLDSLITAAGTEIISKLDSMFEGFDKSGSIATISSSVKEKLKNEIDSLDPVTLDDILEEGNERYDIDTSRKRQNYDKVKKAFDYDIKALNCVMNNAVVPAANLDTAFSARETKLIEDIKRQINGKEFDGFISKNISLIESVKIAELSSEAEQKKLDAAVRNEIREILNTISQDNTKEEV